MPTSSSAARASLRAAAAALAVQLARQRDVLDRGERRDQVEVLEDVADRRTPHPGAPVVAERGQVGALDAHRAGGRAVEAAGEGEQRRLAGAGRAHHGDELAGVRRAKLTAAQRVHLGRALPWTRVTACELGGRWALIGRSLRACVLGRWRWRRGVRAVGRVGSRRARSRASQWSSQRTSASAAKTSESRTSSQARSSRSRAGGAARALEPGVVLQRGHGRGALLLDDRADVDAGHGDRHRQLDRQLVARRLGAGDRVVNQVATSARPASVTPVDRRGPRSSAPVPLDQPVALEPGQGRVDLPDVERPGRAGALLELGAQLVAVHRPLLQQRQQSPAGSTSAPPDPSTAPRGDGYRVCIPRMHGSTRLLDPRRPGIAEVVGPCTG